MINSVLFDLMLKSVGIAAACYTAYINIEEYYQLLILEQERKALHYLNCKPPLIKHIRFNINCKQNE